MSGAELAGTLSTRIALERRDPARDAAGAPAGPWIADGQAWAAMVPIAPGPFGTAEAADGRARWAVTLRVGPAVTLDHRVIWNGRVLKVRGVTADPRTPDRITLTCEETRT